MGLEKLISTLRQNEQKQIDDIWRQVKAEADSIRKTTDEAITRATEDHAEQLASACRKSVRIIFAEAETKAREKKLYGHQRLNEVLRITALQQLSQLRKLDYENVFAQLVKELPDSQWEKIIVNPSDVRLAAQFFNKNIVQSETAISGGLIAINAGGRIVIDNTFEKRLERNWPYILPDLIKQIEEHYVQIKSA